MLGDKINTNLILSILVFVFGLIVLYGIVTQYSSKISEGMVGGDSGTTIPGAVTTFSF
jgi:hypothetical protein